MFLYDCIGFALNNISNITNKVLDILYNCNYYINKSQVIRCLDKEYMYDNYCDISIETCNCIQNSIIYENSIYDVNYYFAIFYISFIFVIMYVYCKSSRLIINNNNINNNNINNSNGNSNDNNNTILLLEEDDNETMVNNNYYVINKSDTLPKYNEIENEANATKITIVEISPPLYNEIEK